jgi:orotate phosphoribosyltransferase
LVEDSLLMVQEDIARLFEETGALLEGHFLLTSGLHSEKYLQCAKVLQWPNKAEACARVLAQRLSSSKPDLVISPAIGGIIIGHEVGRALGCRFLFAERENGVLRLRRGFEIRPKEKALVVEDVITTGGSTLETMEVVRFHGGVVVGAASLVDRSGGKASLGVPYHSLWTLSIPAYKPVDCPLCRMGSKPVKPGSRL